MFTELSSLDPDKATTANICAKITSKIIKNVSTGTILELTLSDGKEFCRAIAWNNLATFFKNKLEINKTYIISGVGLRKIKPQYKQQGALPIELTLTHGVNIKLSDIEIAEKTEIPYCTVENLNQALDERVNIIAIVKSYKDCTSTVTAQGKSFLKGDIVIADHTNKEATATLWGRETMPKISWHVYGMY